MIDPVEKTGDCEGFPVKVADFDGLPQAASELSSSARVWTIGLSPEHQRGRRLSDFNRTASHAGGKGGC